MHETDELQDVMGENAFHMAARFGNAKALQVLIKNCSKAAAIGLTTGVNIDDNTPLHIAAQYCHLQAAAVTIPIFAHFTLPTFLCFTRSCTG